MNKPVAQLQHLLSLQGVPAVNVLRLGGTSVPDGNTVSIGGRVYECDDQMAETITAGRVRVPVFIGCAEATLGFCDTQNVVDGNTVTIGGKVYTFKATLSNVDGYVKIGPTIHRSIYNLVAAVNVGYPDLIEEPACYGEKNDVGEGAGIAYAAATTRNPANVNAGYGNDYDFWLVHWPGGAIGNTVTLAATLVGNGHWVDDVETMCGPQPPSVAQFGPALAAALNNDPAGPVFAEVVSASEILVWSRRSGDVRLPCAASLTDPLNLWDEATLVGGPAGRDELAPVVGVRRVVSAAEASATRLHVILGFVPTGAVVQVSDAGALLPFDGTVAITGRRVTVSASGDVDLTAGRAVQVLAFR